MSKIIIDVKMNNTSNRIPSPEELDDSPLTTRRNKNGNTTRRAQRIAEKTALKEKRQRRRRQERGDSDEEEEQQLCDKTIIDKAWVDDLKKLVLIKGLDMGGYQANTFKLLYKEVPGERDQPYNQSNNTQKNSSNKWLTKFESIYTWNADLLTDVKIIEARGQKPIISDYPLSYEDYEVKSNLFALWRELISSNPHLILDR